MAMDVLTRLKVLIRGTCNLPRLKKNGLKVGVNFKILGECIIDPGHCWLISIGDDVTLAPRVHILAHDASTKMFLGYTKIGKVTIGNHVFVGAGTIILPNTRIADNTIIGAGSVVTKDCESGVYAGNPARYLCSLAEYLDQEKERMNHACVYDREWTIGRITDERKESMAKDLDHKIGFVE